MKRLIALILVAMLLVPTVALASDITGAKWYSIITASNTNTEADDVFAIFSLGTQDLIDADFLNATVTDCAMHDTSGIDTAFMPSVNATYPWCFYVNHIGENAFRNYLLYTGGNADMDGKIRYFPGAGGMTSTDNATLELSDNFTIEQKGWVDTDNGTDKNLVFKKGAFSTYVSPTVSENITATILGWTANLTETRRPDGHDTCVIPSEVGAACNDHYLNVDETGAGDDDTTKVFCVATGATTYTDIYTLEDTSINATSQIMQVQTTVKGENTGSGRYKVGLKLGADTTWATLENDASWTSHTEPLARPGGGSWTIADLDALKIMVYVVANGAAGNDAHVTQCYITTTFQNPVETVAVTATGVESGEHTITVATDNTSLFFGIGKDIVNADFPTTDNLALNAPLWHIELNTSPFTTKDINEHSCTVTGAVWSSSEGRCFDGVNDKITVPNASSVNITDSLTVEAWVYVSTATNFAGILTKKDDAGDSNGYMLDIASNNVRFKTSNLRAEGAVSTGSWYHIVGTYESGTIRLFIDSELKDEVGGQSLLTTTKDVVIGFWDGAEDTYAKYFNGYIGEVRIYSTRVLTLPEIQHNYNASKWKYESSDEYFHYNLLPAGGVLDSDYDWVFVENYSMPYMEHHKIWIDGVLRQHIEYEYDDTTFHDRSFYGLRFDGINDLINCGSANSLDNLTAMTIIIWTNRNAGDLQAVITKNTVPNTNGWDLVLRSASSILFTVDYDGAAALARRGSTVVPVGVFSFVAVTWDGSATATNIHLFYNGVEEPSYVVTTDGVGNRVDDSGQTLRVGVHGNSSGDYTGIIDEILIYNRVLSPEEITHNYNSGVGRYQPYSTAGLVGWWHLEENGSATAIDSSGEGNDGTITGALWVNGHIPKPIGTSGINDATPTFRTASSDADVSAVMASWEPIEEAQAPAWVLEEERDFWDTENITATGEFTATPTPTAAPGIDIIEAISAASGTPTQLPFNVIAGFVILAVSLTATWFLAKHGARSLWLKIIIITICMAVCVGVKVFDFWMVVFFLIMAIAVELFSRQRSRG